MSLQYNDEESLMQVSTVDIKKVNMASHKHKIRIEQANYDSTKNS